MTTKTKLETDNTSPKKMAHLNKLFNFLKIFKYTTLLTGQYILNLFYYKLEVDSHIELNN